MTHVQAEGAEATAATGQAVVGEPPFTRSLFSFLCVNTKKIVVAMLHIKKIGVVKGQRRLKPHDSTV